MDLKGEAETPAITEFEEEEMEIVDADPDLETVKPVDVPMGGGKPESGSKPDTYKFDEEEEESPPPEELDEYEEPIPETLMENLFRNLDINHNGGIDYNDLELLFSDLRMIEMLKNFQFEDHDDIKMDEISDMLRELPEPILKKVLGHKKLKFVESTWEQTNEGDIFALYRVFDALELDRSHLLTEDAKYLKADASGVSMAHLEKILDNLDRKSLLKLLALEHVEKEEKWLTWNNFFNLWKVLDVGFWFVCLVVCAEAINKTRVEDVDCGGRDSMVAVIFEAYIIIKGINYAFEWCLWTCSYLFKHPNFLETRYIMSFLPYLSWAFSIVFRHCSVFVGLVEWGTISDECWKDTREEAEYLVVFFFWALVYECVSFAIFVICWVALPFLTLFLLMIAVNPRNEPGGGDDNANEALTEFVKEQFHRHIRSGDAYFDFLINMMGLKYVVKKNDLARLLVGSSHEQKLSKKDVMLWSENDVYKWLKSIGMEKYAQKFVDDGITGNLLLTHVDPTLLQKGYRCKEEDAKLIWQRLNELRKPTTVGSWSVNEVVDWLCRIKMVQYVEDFRRVEMTGQKLITYSPELQQVLESIPEYHRIKLTREISVLRNEGAPMTVGNHHLNYWSQPLAIKPKSSASTPNTPLDQESEEEDEDESEKEDNSRLEDVESLPQRKMKESEDEVGV